MKVKKFILSGFIVAVIFFILIAAIWLTFYSNIFSSHLFNGILKSEDELNLGLLIISMLSWGFLLSYIMNTVSGKYISKGFIIGMILGYLSNTTFDLTFYATSFLFKGYKIVILNLLIFTIIAGLTSASISLYLSRTNES